MFLGDLLNIPCCPAWTVKIQNLVSQAIKEPYQELRGELDSQKQLFVDESPTQEKREKAWLWVAVASTFTVFGIFANRKRESLKALVGNYQEVILNCDRAKMYFDGKQLQWCWAHLKRDIQKMIDSPDRQVKRLGDDLAREQKLCCSSIGGVIAMTKLNGRRSKERCGRSENRWSPCFCVVFLAATKVWLAFAKNCILGGSICGLSRALRELSQLTIRQNVRCGLQ